MPAQTDSHTHIIQNVPAGTSVRVGKPDGGWFKMFRALIKTGAWADLGAAAKAIYPVLCNKANSCFQVKIGCDDVAPWAGIAPRTARRGLRELVQKELVIVRCDPRGRAGLGVYQLVPPHEKPAKSGRVNRPNPAAFRRPEAAAAGRVNRPDMADRQYIERARDSETSFETTTAAASSPPSAAADVLLRSGKFSPADCAGLAALAGNEVARVRRALDLLTDYDRRGKRKGTAYGFLKGAIEGNWAPTATLERDDSRRKAETRRREQERDERDQAERERQTYEGRVFQVRERLAGMAVSEVQLLVKETLHGLRPFMRETIEAKGCDPQSNEMLAYEIWRHMLKRTQAAAG